MNQEDIYDPELDLRDMLFYILYKWRAILLGGIVFCVLLCGVGITRRMLADPDIEPPKIKEYKLELARYKLDVAGYEFNIADSQERLTQQELYMKESVLMKTDPYAKPTASADFFVRLDDTEWGKLPDNINVDPTDSIIKMYTTSYFSNLDWEPLEKLTGGQEIYLKELLGINTDYNSNTFSISVVYSDGDMAQQILDNILSQVIEQQQDMAEKVNGHSLSVINKSLTYSIDTSLADRKKSNEEAIANYERAILGYQEALDELKEHEPKEPIMIGFVKYPAAGFVLGIFLLAAFYVTSYLLGGKLHGEEELKNRYGCAMLGYYPSPEKKGIFTSIDCFIDKLSQNYIYHDKENSYKRIAVNISNLAGTGKSILITGTVHTEKIQSLTSKIAPMLSDFALTTAGDMNQDVSTLELLAKCDSVILVEEKDKSQIHDIQKEFDSIRSLGKAVIGYVLL